MGIVALGAVSCDSYLDTMPDNRAEVDSVEKVEKLLVSAYSRTGYLYLCEVSSDNTDLQGVNNPYYDQFTEQAFHWQDISEANNESPKMIWGNSYTAIAAANQALLAIEELGSPKEMEGAKGEALLCRAYNHFVLVNLFGQHYSEEHAESDLGVHYMTGAETTLNPKYQRESVRSNYDNIEKDLVEGLSLIHKARFDVPKYHFNPQAAQAFATRFYLYKGEMDKVIKHATAVLGSSPETMIRDNAELASYPAKTRREQYVAPSCKANLLLCTNTSGMGWVFGNNVMNSKFNHGSAISDFETLQTTTPWGEFDPEAVYITPEVYSGTNVNKVLLPRIPRYIEYVDPVAGTGFRRSVYPAFTTDEALLSRAEAFVRLKQYDSAIQDLNIWVKSNYKKYQELTQESIEKWVGDFAYYEPTQPTPIKRLNPDFALEEGTQEKLMQYVLQIRRLETLHLGLRWFDIKRFGIEIPRRIIEGVNIEQVIDKLNKRDKRCAIQLPQEVILAGMEANPR